LLAGALSAAGCGGKAVRWTPDYHVVRSGETLYAIAWRHGLDHRELAAWNGLGDGSLIYPGQRIRLSPAAPAGGQSRPPPAQSAGKAPATRAPPVRPVSGWAWPTVGPVIAAYGTTPKTESGIHIGGRLGQPVLAAAPGEVVYAGSGLVGYGQLLIIKHNETYLSAYGHNQALLVAEGQRVTGGQQVGRMGEGSGKRPILHFEIRRNGQPVDPVGYLPRR
jgi:lipoprotein NlpD